MNLQVVSACTGSVIIVWDIDTGEKIAQFSGCHGKAEITAMSLDTNQHRLATGASNGTIKLWNFNNGTCLAELINHDNTEVNYKRDTGSLEYKIVMPRTIIILK